MLFSAPQDYASVRGVGSRIVVNNARKVSREGYIGYGFGSSGSGGSSDRIDISTHNFNAGGVTCFVLGLVSGSPASGRLYDSDSGGIYAQVNADAGRNTSGSLQYAFPPSTALDNLTASTVVMGSPGSGARAFWRNLDKNSSGDSGSGTPNSISTLYLGNRGANDRQLNGVIMAAAFWSRALNDYEVVELHSSPWQLFRADPIRIYSLPAATIPSSLNVAASNITSSGARATVTLVF